MAASTPNDVMAPLPSSQIWSEGEGGRVVAGGAPIALFPQTWRGAEGGDAPPPKSGRRHRGLCSGGIVGCAAAAALTSPPISGYVVGRVAAATANLPCPPLPDPAASWGGQQRRLAAEKAARRQEVGGSTGELMAALSPTRFSDGDAAPLPPSSSQNHNPRSGRRRGRRWVGLRAANFLYAENIFASGWI